MWIESEAFHQDMETVCKAQFIPWDRLNGKTILVTGATGLIGTALVNALLYANEVRNLSLEVLALVRDKERAQRHFAAQLKVSSALRFTAGSVEALPPIAGVVDYIVHGASQTASRAFVERPVETIQTAIYGTDNILKLARDKHSRGVVYLSSMEVYGHPQRGHKIKEEEIGALSPLDVRNSYPISKIQCESLCHAYAEEYDVPVMIMRLTQTFGPDVSENDQRIFAQFGHCVREKRDIVLKTKGETERSYLYTSDAATAILCVLLKGMPGTAYNVADEATYCSIAEMAQRVAEMGGVNVRFQLEDAAKCGYPDPLYMDMDTGRLKRLGWQPRTADAEILLGLWA